MGHSSSATEYGLALNGEQTGFTPNSLMLGRETIQTIQLMLGTVPWAFPYWPGFHPSTPSRDDNQANMEMPMY
jgi:hypothetical protein